MATVYVDINCSDDTGTAESPYFTALLGESTAGYKEFETGLNSGSLASEDTIHVAPGVYTPSTGMGGANLRRYIIVYGRVEIDGSSAGNQHGLLCQFSGWLYFTAGTSDAIWMMRDYVDAVSTRQILYGTPGLFDFRGVTCVLSNGQEGIRVNSSGAATHHFDRLILHELERGIRADGAGNVTTEIDCLVTNHVDRVIYPVSGAHVFDVNQSLLGPVDNSYHFYSESSWSGVCNFNNIVSVGGMAHITI